jgi:hypothetical protein
VSKLSIHSSSFSKIAQVFGLNKIGRDNLCKQEITMKAMVSVAIDIESLIQDMNPAQAETLLGGYCQYKEDYPYGYIINITKFEQDSKKQPESTKSKNFSNQKINTIDNSRKIYINGVPIKGERNIIVI